MKTTHTHSISLAFGLSISLTAILLIFALFPLTVKAQWNTNTSENLLISGLPTADIQTASTTDGKTWIAFYHENSGNYDMRAQLIDANGYKLLGADGMLVSNQTSGSATFVFNVCVDASNNLIIGYQDERSGSLQAVVYKISQAGTQLWGANGIVLGGGLAPYPTALSNGEVVIAWIADAGNTLNLQKITTGGSPAWDTPIPITVGSTGTTRGQIIANNAGKFTVVYQKRGYGISTTLYAQMFDNSGTAIYAPLQICDQTSSAARYYSIASEGDTTYFGYYASVSFRFNSFLQRINPDGTIPWGMNGSIFNTATGTYDDYQMETDINITPGSNYVWSVANFCDYNQTNYGVYIQKYLKTTGARQFTDAGKVVYTISSFRDQHAGSLALVFDTPMFMSYDSDDKIYATRLDASGNFSWTPNRVEMSSTTAGGSNPKMRFGFTPDGPNRCAGVWTENRGSAYMGYAQGISVGGLIGLVVATQGGLPPTISTQGGTLQMVATVYPSTANQSVNWSIVPGTGAATISAGGLVTAVANGTVYAKANAVQDPSVKDSLMITISGQAPQAPSVTTLAATGITGTVATLNGSVNANNSSTTVSFNWGLTTGYGNTIAATPPTVTGTSSTSVLANISGLTPGATYHFRCVGVNSVGTTYGADLTFTTCLTPATPGTITGPASVCQNQDGVIYSVPPIANATTYNWTVPNGATITAGAGTVSITVSFSASASSGNVTVAGANSCESGPTGSLAVTVNPAPLPTITGSNNTCAGSGTTPYTTESGMSNYTWAVSGGGTIISGGTTNTIQVQWNNPGYQNVSVNYSNTNGCRAQNSALFDVIVHVLPSAAGTITGSSSVCAGDQGVSYSVDPIAEAVSYIWTLPTGATIASGSGTNIITVNFAFDAVSGPISVTGNNVCGNGPASNLTITVNSAPPTPTITVNGYVLTSSAASGNQWYKDGTAIAGATSQTYTVQATAWYWTIVTLSGCPSDSSNHLYVLYVGMDEKNAVNVEIYPVPNDGKFNIIIRSQTEVLYKLDVCNNLGQTIYSGLSFTANGNSMTKIDLGVVPNGIYTLILRNSDNQIIRKILVNR